MELNIGLSDSDREGVASILNTLLAGEYIDLETCTEKHHDAGTTDFLTGLMERHEKMAWMLRAFLEGEWAS